MAKLTPEQQKAYDDMRAQPGILFDAEGNVIFDGEAEATGAPPFKTRAEFDAQQAKLQAQLAEFRKSASSFHRGTQRDDCRFRGSRPDPAEDR